MLWSETNPVWMLPGTWGFSAYTFLSFLESRKLRGRKFRMSLLLSSTIKGNQTSKGGRFKLLQVREHKVGTLQWKLQIRYRRGLHWKSKGSHDVNSIVGWHNCYLFMDAHAAPCNFIDTLTGYSPISSSCRLLMSDLSRCKRSVPRSIRIASHINPNHF